MTTSTPPDLTPDDERKIAGILSAFDGVDAVYLFGSVAEGRARPGSDVDIAIVPENHAAIEARLDMLTALAREGFDRVDLVFLEGSDLVLQFNAVRQNRPLYTSPRFSHGDYFSRTIRQHQDLEPLLRVRHSAYRKRALNG
jgi:uncharacterized protein